MKRRERMGAPDASHRPTRRNPAPAPAEGSYEPYTPPKPAATRLLSADDLAERWSVPKGHVYRLTRSGSLPTVRLGRYYRYAPEAIEAFEHSGGAASDA